MLYVAANVAPEVRAREIATVEYESTAVFAKEARAAYTRVAVSRDLTSGATLTATYSSADDSLILKAAVTF